MPALSPALAWLIGMTSCQDSAQLKGSRSCCNGLMTSSCRQHGIHSRAEARHTSGSRRKVDKSSGPVTSAGRQRDYRGRQSGTTQRI